MRFPCKLEGGPFDGDQGSWQGSESLPEKFWAYPCPGEYCASGGIHWTSDPIVARDQGAEPYVWDREDEDDAGAVHVYVHADLNLGSSGGLDAREREPALA